MAAALKKARGWRKGIAILFATVATIDCYGAAHAQTIPDSSSLRRDLRQGLPGFPPETVPGAPERRKDSAPGAEHVRVDRFVVEGATLVSTTAIDAVLGNFSGRDLDMAGLETAAQAVSALYRRKGYFARAYLPPQDVSGGIVRIRVIEGRFGKIQLDDRAKRADARFVEHIVGSALTTDQPYSARALERGLLIANDLPGVTADGVLKSGDAYGTSDLALTVRDTPLVTGSVGADNAGVSATGLYRGMVSLSVNDPTGHGDQISLLGLGSRGLAFGQAGWSLPIGTDGWRVRMYGSVMRYWLGGQYAVLDGKGEADTEGLELSYPIVRRSDSTLNFRAAYEHGHYHDDLLDAPLHRKQIDRISLGFDGSSTDGWGGGGRSSYRMTGTAGGLDLSDKPYDRPLDRLTADADGAFFKIDLDALRDQRIAAGLFARGHVSAQWALNNLDSSEQFALGGPYGVRAYPVNEALGDAGMVGNIELHAPIGSGALRGLDLYGFFDAGAIRLHATPWPGWGPPGADNSYALYGVGAGLTYVLPHHIQISAVIAAPIGDDPGAPDSLHTQDGSRRRARGWFTVNKTF